MHFENVETLEYKRSTLFEVAFQARFPEILEIQSEAPIAFQEELIKEGYTEIRSRVQYGDLPSNQTLEPSKIFNFLSEQDDWEVTLSRHYLTLSCYGNDKDYIGFKNKLEKVLRIFRAIYKPPYFTRIGLVYRNMANRVFLPQIQTSQISVESFIPKYIFPLLETPMADDVFSLHTISQFNDNEIKVAVYHTLSEETGIYSKTQVTNEKSYTIEIDCFYDSNIYNNDVGVIDGILTKCDSFKQLEWNIFQWSITDTLQEVLGKSQL